jgi:hypothetical protein
MRSKLVTVLRDFCPSVQSVAMACVVSPSEEKLEERRLKVDSHVSVTCQFRISTVRSVRRICVSVFLFKVHVTMFLSDGTDTELTCHWYVNDKCESTLILTLSHPILTFLSCTYKIYLQSKIFYRPCSKTCMCNIKWGTPFLCSYHKMFCSFWWVDSFVVISYACILLSWSLLDVKRSKVQGRFYYKIYLKYNYAIFEMHLKIYLKVCRPCETRKCRPYENACAK